MDGRPVAIIWVSGALIALFLGLSFWPGTMNPDAMDMLAQGKAAVFSDWHTPLLAWAWGYLDAVVPGPGGLFAVNLACFIAGHAIVATCFLRQGMPGRAALCMLALLFPMTAYALLDVGKDVFMTSALLFLTGIFLWRAQRPSRFFLLLLPLIVGILLLVIDSRKNAFAAVFPIILFVLCSGRPGLRPTWRAALLAVGITLTVQGAAWVIDHQILRAKAAHPLVALEVFDLAGESYFAGTDVSHGLLGDDFMAQTEKCYDHRQWDPFMWGACSKVGGTALGRIMNPGGDAYADALRAAWTDGMMAHPLAYLKHRMAYWSTFLRLQCDACDEVLYTIYWGQWNPPDHLYQPTLIARRLDTIAANIARSPLARPYVWLLDLAICFSICASRAFRAHPSVLASTGAFLSLSGLLYALTYLPVGLATPLRYLFWTYVSGLLAPVFASAALAEVFSLRGVFGLVRRRAVVANWLRHPP